MFQQFKEMLRLFRAVVRDIKLMFMVTRFQPLHFLMCLEERYSELLSPRSLHVFSRDSRLTDFEIIYQNPSCKRRVHTAPCKLNNSFSTESQSLVALLLRTRLVIALSRSMPVCLALMF